MPITLIIAAGGKSVRFQKSTRSLQKKKRKQPVNKLLLPFDGKPLLAATLTQFQSFDQISETIVAVPEQLKPTVRSWEKEYGLKKVKWVRGGSTRAESVLKALKKSSAKNAWVMVHDGARPLVPQGVIKKLIGATKSMSNQALIVGKKVVPTIKQVKKNSKKIEKTVDRQFLYEAETPQLMKKKDIAAAYKSNKQSLRATDESSLLESVGVPVKVLSHEEWNPKITTFQDIELAKAYIKKSESVEYRTGIGTDLHRLIYDRKLYIGGIHIPYHKGALGHSDGDVLLHAMSDALLGIVGKGDIGDYFSDTNPKIKGIRSDKILKRVLKIIAKEGWQITHMDGIVTLEKPKLGELKRKIQNNMQKLLGLDSSSVSIKAKTSEGLGPEGNEAAISAQVIVTVRRTVS